MLALSAGIYPIALRSTGIGWAMSMGRLGEVILPLLIALLLSVIGGLSGGVFLIIALMPALGALSILFWAGIAGGCLPRNPDEPVTRSIVSIPRLVSQPTGTDFPPFLFVISPP